MIDCTDVNLIVFFNLKDNLRVSKSRHLQGIPFALSDQLRFGPCATYTAITGPPHTPRGRVVHETRHPKGHVASITTPLQERQIRCSVAW